MKSLEDVWPEQPFLKSACGLGVLSSHKLKAKTKNEMTRRSHVAQAVDEEIHNRATEP